MFLPLYSASPSSTIARNPNISEPFPKAWSVLGMAMPLSGIWSNKYPFALLPARPHLHCPWWRAGTYLPQRAPDTPLSARSCVKRGSGSEWAAPPHSVQLSSGQNVGVQTHQGQVECDSVGLERTSKSRQVRGDQSIMRFGGEGAHS